MVGFKSQFRKMIVARLTSGIILALMFIFLNGCDQTNGDFTIPPRAIKGEIDLQNWDFEKNNPIRLNGEWEFYWNQLLTPEDFQQSASIPSVGYFKVPQSWNGRTVNGIPLSGNGYSTYRLKLKLAPKQEFYALKITDLATAYRLWLNGKIVLQSGVVGKSREDMEPQYYPKTSVVHLLPGENTIIIQVSNFNHKKGGIWKSIFLGSEKSISRLRERIMSFEIFLFGTLMVIGMYHLGIYFMRKTELTALLFALVSIFIGTRGILTGERIFILIFPNVNWEFFQKLEYLTFYFSAPLFYIYLYSLFPEFSKLLGKFAVFFGASFCLIVLITPVRIYSHTVIVFQVLIFLYSFYIVITLIKVIMRKREAGYWVLTGVVLFLMSVFHDILTVNEIIDNTQLSSLGLFMFIFLQSLMLSFRLTKSFSNVEKIHDELAESNKAKDGLLGALTASEKKYRELVENIDVVVWTMDLTGRVTYSSPSIEKITGFTPDNLLNTMGSEFIYRDDLSQALECFKKTVEGFEQHLTCRMVTKWDSTRWVRFNLRPLMENGKTKGLQGLLTDITEHKKNREIMVQTEKIMSVGGLAAGMAHELNNPLGAIMQAAQVIKQRLFSEQKKNMEKADRYSINLAQLSSYLTEQKVLHFLDGIQEAGNRASKIISNMLLFSRKSDSKMKKVDLASLIEKTLELANHRYDLEKEIDFKQINIIKEFDSGPQLALCSETEIGQVFLNLLVNAAQALFLEDAPSKPMIIVRLKKEGEFARVEVEDNGPGMDEDTRRRIFEPFFTTKGVGKGTGLGLSVSYMIITKNHTGAFEVESEIGKGTKFIIWLPREKQVVKTRQVGGDN